jgi:hypothetical protein
MVIAETAVQAEALITVADRLEEFAQVASRRGTIMLLDTNVFLQHKLFPDIGWLAEFNVEYARLVVPLAVLDELDDKTFSGNNCLSKRASKDIELSTRPPRSQPARQGDRPSRNGRRRPRSSPCLCPSRSRPSRTPPRHCGWRPRACYPRRSGSAPIRSTAKVTGSA